jgi:hypothetical protein
VVFAAGDSLSGAPSRTLCGCIDPDTGQWLTRIASRVPDAIDALGTTIFAQFIYGKQFHHSSNSPWSPERLQFEEERYFRQISSRRFLRRSLALSQVDIRL